MLSNTTACAELYLAGCTIGDTDTVQFEIMCSVHRVSVQIVISKCGGSRDKLFWGRLCRSSHVSYLQDGLASYFSLLG